MGELYQLYFPQSGKSYIGITTVDAKARFCQHKHDANTPGRGRGVVLYKAWKKHGQPELRVLARLENDDLSGAEIRAVAIMGTQVPHGYNVTPGGPFPCTLIPGIAERIALKSRGRKHSPEHIAKRVEKLRGMKRSAESKRKMWDNKSDEGKARSISNLVRGVLSPAGLERLRSLNTGKKLSEETKRKIGEAAKGREVSAETREKKRRAATGKRCSDETKQKLRAANLGKKQSAETREKMSVAQKSRTSSTEARANISKRLMGHLVSDATRAKIRDSNKKTWSAKMRGTNNG